MFLILRNIFGKNFFINIVFSKYNQLKFEKKLIVFMKYMKYMLKTVNVFNIKYYSKCIG